jgi:RNA polymerase sigma factor (sigma-70 family)
LKHLPEAAVTTMTLRTAAMRQRDGGTTSPVLLNRLVDWRDDAAWREFVERYRPLIEGWCRRMRLDADTSDELCQRIWINLARRMSNFQYDPSRKFRAWLRCLCYSRAVDLLRERRARSIRALADEPSSALRLLSHEVDGDTEDEAATGLPAMLRLGQRVHDLVKSQVGNRTWQAFWLIAVDGLTVRQTADALNMSYAATFAAHKRVAQRLRDEGSRVLQERKKFGVDSPLVAGLESIPSGASDSC